MRSSPVDTVILVLVAVLVLAPEKLQQRFANFSRTHAKASATWIKVFMGLYMLWILAEALFRNDWASLACMPFAVLLLPQFERVMKWAFRQRYLFATFMLVVMLPLMLSSNFIYMYVRTGALSFTTDIVLKIGYLVVTALLFELSVGRSERKRRDRRTENEPL